MKVRVLKRFVRGRLEGSPSEVLDVKQYDGLNLIRAGIAEEITVSERQKPDAGKIAPVQQENPGKGSKRKEGKK